MLNRTGLWLVIIAVLVLLAGYMIWPNNPGLLGRPIQVRPGLDVQGGLRVLLSAEAGTDIDAGKMEQARQIVDRRVNALGVAEPVVQVAGGNRIIVELPGVNKPEDAINTIKQTGLLEFVDFSPTGACSAAMPIAGQYVLTDRQLQQRGAAAPNAQGTAAATAAGTQVATPAATAAATAASTAAATTAPTAAATATAQATAAATTAATAAATSAATTAATPAGTQAATPAATAAAAATSAGTPAATPAATAAATAAGTPAATPATAARDGSSKEKAVLNPCTQQPFSTIMTGAGLQNAEPRVGGNAGASWVVSFNLAGNEESSRFATHTASHVNQVMAIVLDGRVLSAPVIRSALTTGGQIEGNFNSDSAKELALQLRYGALPVSLVVESTEQVGASLGAESIQASIQAGIIGLIVLIAFMLLYYRLPGLAAVMALIVFAAINFALYKFIPVTLTLPAIIGFIISVGTAVDGNVLIFERIKEELRVGRRGDKALELGFSRAWSSIRDSNLSTIFVGLILYFFGGQFGAGAVRGFALTLILGLLINMFTVMIVTRTFMHLIMQVSGEGPREKALFSGDFGQASE